MTFDIIENNVLRNHKYWFSYKWILFAFIIFILLESFNIISLVSKYNEIWDFFVLPFLIILTFFNIFAQFRVGEYMLKRDFIEINYNDKARFFKYFKSEKVIIDLEEVQTAKIRCISSNQFIVKLDNKNETTIKASHSQIEKIKEYLTENNITILKTDLINSIKRWFKKED